MEHFQVLMVEEILIYRCQTYKLNIKKLKGKDMSARFDLEDFKAGLHLEKLSYLVILNELAGFWLHFFSKSIFWVWEKSLGKDGFNFPHFRWTIQVFFSSSPWSLSVIRNLWIYFFFLRVIWSYWIIDVCGRISLNIYI